MRIVDAFWEKRNLNVECVEMLIENGDSLEYIREQILKNEKEYSVVKVPSSNTDALFLMNELGYIFIETSLDIVRDLASLELSDTYKSLTDCVTYEIMNQSDIDQMFYEIKKGIFTTDRVYLDPYFSREQSANRYIGWLSDEIESGSDVYKYIYEGKSIGFFAIKASGDNAYDQFLAGLYSEYLNTGFGINMPLKGMIEIKRRGAKKYSTNVSTNNRNSLDVHMLLNCKIKKMFYVYVKHIC